MSPMNLASRAAIIATSDMVAGYASADVAQHQRATPPPSLTDQPLTPPLADKKNITRDTQIEFELAEGEYSHIERTLQQDDVLSGYVQDKIRYDYDEDRCGLAVRMPTETHERSIDALEDDIRSQLKKIRNGSGKKAEFAQNYEPDVSFRQEDAQYPGVIIEVAYSQKKTRFGRLAESYLLDSDANVRVVVGLDIAYSKESRKATLSSWRPQLFDAPDGPELRAVDVVMDEAFRDDEGNPRLTSGIQLCRYVDAAESKVRRALRTESLGNNVKKRKRSEIPPEEIQSSDEAKYAKQEERAAKRADHDH
ncbi:hypothetical protein CC80DRAFT_527689 [Byssothecium circinans]|uniref:Restriction endonuclease domain-containing protein n=1 Tax=Byssothecium circinans TaxID=147558 RepID=A0A6A5TL26_9PLEO|nr:hypothetical protein CC80DRAFT_527689 [Byssothecium circinans]